MSSIDVDPPVERPADSDEQTPLLASDKPWSSRIVIEKLIVPVVLTVAFIIATIVALVYWKGGLPADPDAAAEYVLSRTPVVDTHIDMPWLLRGYYGNNLSKFDLREPMPGHVDIPRLRKGHVGGAFWSVYVPCAEDFGGDDGDNFTTPTYRVRDTLEQIDVTRLYIDEYSDVFEFVTDSSSFKEALLKGKIASFLGVEGGHQLGNSLGVLRTYYALGIRYMTLTHSCNNAFADSAGIDNRPSTVHGGLSPIGYALIREMNRLGMLVDLSHVSDATAIQALATTKAPVIWSHSSARAVHNVPRNVPDVILQMIGEGEGKVDGVVQVNFAPMFVADPGGANVSTVADHVEHIARVAGIKHVGLGSDYDGIPDVPKGLEDVSKYPALFAELKSRGWGHRALAGLAHLNLLRVMEGAEAVSRQMQRDGVPPAMEVYSARTDL